ncbi:MAG: glycosyltransferase family protein [Syntrophomonadaceae bacterium]|nr:glycosyltransferase family protein [Syntrophomonadaceae bacterium]
MNSVIVQARMGSTRLPGKVLKKICGKTLLELQNERIQMVAGIDRIVIATTVAAGDDEIVQVCTKNGIDCFRGSENDVLDRYYQTACKLGCKPEDTILRITADCPLIDPQVVISVLQLYHEARADYASNTDPPTYPDGLDVEVFSFAVLARTWQEANLPSEREHVTAYIRNHPELFTRVNLKNDIDLSNLRWTIDEPEDFELVRLIYENLYILKRDFLMNDVLELLNKNPDYKNINKSFVRNEGYQKSLLEDARLLNTIRAGDNNGER